MLHLPKLKHPSTRSMGCAASSETSKAVSVPPVAHAQTRPQPTFQMIPDRYETIGAAFSILILHRSRGRIVMHYGALTENGLHLCVDVQLKCSETCGEMWRRPLAAAGV